jgi:hypothetical protein
MKDERDSHSPSDPAPVSSDEGHADAARLWRAPTVTRVSLEQTLFGLGSPTDLSSTGAITGA